ncbi:SurA N-terminal domain-containing protein [Candidatus Avelusimicrobium stercoris]|uniref:SurA N-terminal domain-containing protein n=1 Tax=Candidatus Avelusimicrobium stercoris TaxID=1947924 RepID=UPI003D0C2E7B
MISFLIKHKKIILIITLAFFLGSIVYLGADAYRRGNFSSTAAKVGSEDITYRQLYRVAEDRARALRNQGIDVDEDMMKYLRQQMLAALISEEVLNQAANKAGLAVSDYEVAYDIKTSPFFTQNGYFSKTAYEYALKRTLGLTPAEFETQLRKGKMADRFRGVLYSFYKLTPEEIKYAYKTQHGSMKNFDKNRADFAAQLMETKMETAQRAFFDQFNNEVEIKTFLQD